MRIGACAASIVLGFYVCLPVAANGDGQVQPPKQTQTLKERRAQRQMQRQQQRQQQVQSQTALGGTGGSGSATAAIDQTISADYSSRALSLFNGSAIPVDCPPGWVPKEKFGRGWQTPFLGISAICRRDANAVKDVEAARAHEITMADKRLEELRMLIERDREATRRIEAEAKLVTSTTKQ